MYLYPYIFTLLANSADLDQTSISDKEEFQCSR